MSLPLNLIDLIETPPNYFINIGVGVGKDGTVSKEAQYVKNKFPDINIYGIEADKERYELIKKDFPGSLHYGAVGNTDKPVTMYKDPCGSGIDMVIGSKINDKVISQPATPGIMLDKFCNEHNIGKEFTDKIFLWADCEGHELEILKGAHNLLKKHLISYIILELWVCSPYPETPWIEAKSVIEYLNLHGYIMTSKSYGNKYDALFQPIIVSCI